MTKINVTVDPTAEIESEITAFMGKENELREMELALEQNEQFKAFLALQKEVKETGDAFWKYVETQMISHDIKSIKTSLVTVTIAERLNWDVDEEQLPKKFFKKVIDTTKLSATYKLEGVAPKGATPRYTKFIQKRIK